MAVNPNPPASDTQQQEPGMTAETRKAIEEHLADARKKGILKGETAETLPKALFAILDKASDASAKDVLENLKPVTAAKTQAEALAKLKPLTDSIADAAVDASIRTDGKKDAEIVDALASLRNVKTEKGKAEVAKHLQEAVADAKEDAGETDEQKKKKKKDEPNPLAQMLAEPGGMIMMLILAVIMALGGKNLGDLFGGGGDKEKDEKQAAKDPKTADKDGPAALPAEYFVLQKDDKPTRYEKGTVFVKDDSGKAHQYEGVVYVSKEDSAKLEAYAKEHKVETGAALSEMRKEDLAKTGKYNPVEMFSHYNEKGQFDEKYAAAKAPVLDKGEQAQLVADVTKNSKALEGDAQMIAALQEYNKSKNIPGAVQDEKGQLSATAVKEALDRFMAENNIKPEEVKTRLDKEIAARKGPVETPGQDVAAAAAAR